MIFVYIIIISISVSELLFRLPIFTAVNSITIISRKAIHTIKAPNVSDHWKERAILRYASIIFLASITLIGYCVILFAVVVFIGFISMVLGEDLFGFISTPRGLLLLTIVSLVYIFIRKHMSNSRYNILDKVLHYIALHNRFLAEASFDLEHTVRKFNVTEIINRKHIFIIGLARAGTTVLMQRFYSSKMFGALTYRDMPFVLMPNIWRTLSAMFYKPATKEMRAHGDGLMVDYDSPVALEEVFWRIFAGDSYIKKDRLVPMDVDDEDIDHFRLYIASVLARSDGRKNYLSKNNNNVLRLAAIKKAFPRAIIIIPFRDPLQQADSLLRMHTHFLEEHNKDKFSLIYMNWLVHHEFGAAHKPFDLGYAALRTTPDSLDYWLEVWLYTYMWLYSHAAEDALFLSYESLCVKTDIVWPLLMKIADMPEQPHCAEELKLAKHDITKSYDHALLERANAHYVLLKEKEKDFLAGRC